MGKKTKLETMGSKITIISNIGTYRPSRRSLRTRTIPAGTLRSRCMIKIYHRLPKMWR